VQPLKTTDVVESTESGQVQGCLSPSIKVRETYFYSRNELATEDRRGYQAT